MNKAVIYISGTTNETVNNMIVEVLERYCEKHEYEIVALLGENSQAGMSMPMKYSFIGMAEVEDIDAVEITYKRRIFYPRQRTALQPF